MRIDLSHLRKLFAFSCVLAALCSAGVVDRTAVIVGKTVFTESEVEDEARLTAMESGKPLDLSATERKQAAQQLVDRHLLREEMTATGFKAPAVDPDALLRNFRQRHYSTAAQYRAALEHYGVGEDALKQRLIWEVTLLRFTDERFKPLGALADNQTANRSASPTQPAGDPVGQQMDAWLQQQRADTRIVFIPEAFQ